MAHDVTPEALRAKAVEALRAPGERRKRLLTELDQAEAELRPLVVEAARMEVPAVQIADLTGLSRNTVAAWCRKGSTGGPSRAHA